MKKTNSGLPVSPVFTFKIQFIKKITLFAVLAFLSGTGFLFVGNPPAVNAQKSELVDYAISGSVKSDGANLAGANVILSGASAQTATTDAGGGYSFTVPAGGNYTVSVYKNGFTFNPASQTFNNLQTNQTADFPNGVPLCTPAPAGLVGWYKGEGSSGDSVGGNNGTIFGADYDAVTAKVGQSFRLYGTTGYVQIPDADANRLTDRGSIGLWLRLNSSADGVILDKGRADNNQASYTWEIYQGTLRFDLYRGDGGASYATVQFPASEIVGQWTHLTATWDAGNLRLYKNGVLQNAAAYAFSRVARTDLVYIGHSTNTARPPVNGNVDELQFYNRALSVSEIAAVADAGSAGVCTLAQLPAANGKIAFWSDRDGNREIYSINPDGTNSTRLTNNTDNDFSPNFSSDGSKIVYTRYQQSSSFYDIYTMNADGSAQTRLTNDSFIDAAPSFSPDGTQIVYESYRNGNYEIYLMNASGSNQVRLISEGDQDRQPVFSPDGQKIAWKRDLAANEDIYIANANGTGQVRLTNSGGTDDYPAFSPDGTKIVFNSVRDNGISEIYIMNPDGTNQTRLTNNSFADYAPSFSPDGTKITFTSTRDGNSEIYVMNADGTNQVRASNNPATDEEPSWQPFRSNPNTGAGTLDTSFGTGGKATTSVGGSFDLARSMAIQTDGRIVLVGQTSNGSNNDFVLVRFNAGGTLDTSFGTGGKVTTPIGSFDDIAYTAAIQPDGKIIAAGYSSSAVSPDFALVRYNSNGTLDTSFGTGGKVTTPFGANSFAYSIAIQADGKIIAGGYFYNGSNYDFALVRYNADGSLDTAFGTGGKVTTPIGSSNDYAVSMGLQADGKIVAAGYFFNGANYDFALVRYNPNGSLDTSFNSTGKVTTPIGSFDDYALSMGIQPDGKIVATGYFYNGANYNFALARYNTDGTLDTNFGAGGKVTTPIGNTNNFANSMAIQTDGKIVTGGYAYNGVNNDFAVARFNPNGTLDTSFGVGGRTTTPIGSLDDFALSVGLQPDGKIVAGGHAYTGSTYNFAVARYNINSSISPAGNLDVNFAGVTQTGNTVATPLTASQLPALPTGYTLPANTPIYDIRTSAVHSGGVSVTFNVPNVADAATCSKLRSLHFENGAWTSNTGAVPQYNAGTMVCTVSQTVASLSPFVVAQLLAPTAANVSVGGQVSAGKSGIANVTVTLTDANGATRTVKTNSFGKYQFTDVPVGTAIITVASKRFVFENPTQIVNVADNISDFDFTAIE